MVKKKDGRSALKRSDFFAETQFKPRSLEHIVHLVTEHLGSFSLILTYSLIKH